MGNVYCECIQNERKFDYLILTNFIIIENIILFLFNIINLFRNAYRNAEKCAISFSQLEITLSGDMSWFLPKNY